MEVGIEISATNGGHKDRQRVVQETRGQLVAGTPPLCLQKALTLCVRNVLPSARNHPEDGMGRIRIFSRTPRIKLDACCPSACGPPCSLTAHSFVLFSILPKPKGECVDSVHPCGWGSTSTFFLQELWGRRGGALKRPFPCWNNAGHFAWCRLHSSCLGRSPEPSRALFLWQLFNGQD